MSWNSLMPKLRAARWDLLGYLLLTAVVTAILFWRFPNNVTAANFYAEDGSVFLQNIIDDGWMKAAVTPFNGYGIVGLYLICGLGWVINELALGGTLMTLPAGFAWAAILFMAAAISLPYLLLRPAFGRPATLMTVAFGALMPLPNSPHVVIGTVGNQKWIFLYLAFILVLYRLLRHKQLGWAGLAAVDLALVICAYTNSTVYLLAPALLLPYLRDFWNGRRSTGLREYVGRVCRNKDFLSLAALYALLVPQVLYVATHGIPKLAGYLDTPFNPLRAVELFGNRTYLFGVTHAVNARLNDWLVLLLLILMLLLAWLLLKGRQRVAFWLGVYTAGMASALFTLNRTGVTDHFQGYAAGGSGPDQFFYAQTLVMYLPIVLLAGAVAGLVRRPAVRLGLMGAFAGLVVASGLASNAYRGEAWRNASVFENDAGIFTDQALQACRGTGGQTVRTTVYPHEGGKFSLYAPRPELCSDLSSYQPAHRDLDLKINNNHHLPVLRDGEFTQTVLAQSDGLEGVRIFLSTFGKGRRDGTYQLIVRDAACRKELRRTAIPEVLLDNTYYNARFAPIINSAKSSYCFTFEVPKGKFDPIAIQLSQPDVYPEGQYTQGGQALAIDSVFDVLYKPRTVK